MQAASTTDTIGEGVPHGPVHARAGAMAVYSFVYRSAIFGPLLPPPLRTLSP